MLNTCLPSNYLQYTRQTQATISRSKYMLNYKTKNFFIAQAVECFLQRKRKYSFSSLCNYKTKMGFFFKLVVLPPNKKKSSFSTPCKKLLCQTSKHHSQSEWRGKAKHKENDKQIFSFFSKD